MLRQGSGSWQAAPRRLRRSRRRAHCAPLGITRGLLEAVRQGRVKLDHRRVPNASNDRVVRVKRVKRPRRSSQATAARAPNARNDHVVSLEEPPLKKTTAPRAPNAPNDRVMRVKRIERPRRWCQTTASSPSGWVLRRNGTTLQGTAVQRHWITRYLKPITQNDTELQAH